jgi:predicted dehydrogenase
MVVMSDREKKSPSDRKFDLCVYNDDKDIVDTQVSILEYANGVNAAFALNLFAPRGKRTMAIVGTEGYLDADTENCLIKITSSIGLPDEEICCKPMNGSGHGGSDSLFFEDFIKNINNGWKPKADWQAGMITTIVGNALEKARLTGDNVKILQSEYK